MADRRTFRLYLNCSELPIWNFHQMGKEINYAFLVKNVEDIEEVDSLPINSPQIWKEIYNEYCDISDNTDSQEYLRSVGQLNELDQKYRFCLILVEIILTTTDKEILQKTFKELSAWGFAFNQSKMDTELDRFMVWLRSIKSQMNFINAELESHLKSNTHPIRLEKQQVKLERATGRNDIDLKKCSVAKWLEIIKDAEEIARLKEKSKNKAA